MVGDVLFAGSIGRTDFPGGDYDTLINAIKTQLWASWHRRAVHSGPRSDVDLRRRTPIQSPSSAITPAKGPVNRFCFRCRETGSRSVTLAVAARRQPAVRRLHGPLTSGFRDHVRDRSGRWIENIAETPPDCHGRIRDVLIITGRNRVDSRWKVYLAGPDVFLGNAALSWASPSGRFAAAITSMDCFPSTPDCAPGGLAAGTGQRRSIAATKG